MMGIKNFNQIDAYFIRNLRVNNQDSGDTLAHALNVNKTYLYYIENGNKKLSPEFFNKVLTYYGVTYDQSNELFEEAYNLTIKAYEAVIFKNKDLLNKYEIEFNQKKEVYAYSRAFIFLDLMSAIFKILAHDECVLDLLKNAYKYVSLYDSNIAYIYGVIYPFIMGVTANLVDSKKLLLDIFNSYPNHNILPSIKGMFYYELGRIYFEEKQFLNSLQYYHEAIESLKSIYCIERVNQANIEIANILLKLELFDDAEKKYLELLKEAQESGFKRRTNACLSNLSYLCLLQDRFEECKKYVFAAKKAGSVHYDLNYYLAYCAYMTDSKANARSIITKLLCEKNDVYTSRMLKMIQGFVNDNTSKIDTYFELLKNDQLTNGDKMELNLLFKMVISYYVNKDVNKCAQLVDKYLHLQKV